MQKTQSTLQFTGNRFAELFTLELRESLTGVLTKNLISDPENPNYGFVCASVDKRYWWDTMWTRDAGVFLRELVLWGRLEEACLVARKLIKLVSPNKEGFYTFPEYFRLGETNSGSELDGTSAILIGLCLLCKRLEKTHPARIEILSFLSSEKSPCAYVLHVLEHAPLIAGSGEFGGGCGIEGEFYNVVQNAMVFLFLDAAAPLLPEAQGTALRKASALLRENMLKYLVDEENCWIWCIRTDTEKPDPQIVNHPINKGFGGLNGVFSMLSDVYGFAPDKLDWPGVQISKNTFARLLSHPRRKEVFEKYGAWSQFNEYFGGYLSSPSYGLGYAMQAMLLSDQMPLASKAFRYLTEETFSPYEKYHLDRESPYHFYERFYLPEAFEEFSPEQGCGALNLVNVAEPLKIARLIAGIDDTNPDCIRMIPRFPDGIEGFCAEHWPLWNGKGLSWCNLRMESGEFSIEVTEGDPLPALEFYVEKEFCRECPNGKRFYAKNVSSWKVRTI